MARGVKRLTLEEQLAKIDSEINNMELSLNELREAKKDLEEQIKLNRLAELDELIAAKGISFDTLKELLATTELLSNKGQD